MVSPADFLPPLAGAVTGVVLKWFYDTVATKRRFKRELEDNDNIDVSGEWYAAWETSVDGAQNINTEHVRIMQKGKTLRIWNTERSPENPRAGYLWEGQMQFLQGRNVMGWYFPRAEENNASKGIIYLTFLSPRKLFYGKWVGTAYDGELVTGCVVVAKDRSVAKQQLESFASQHGSDIRLIGYSGVNQGELPSRTNAQLPSPTVPPTP